MNQNIAVLTPEQWAALCSTDTPTICNILELFGTQSRIEGFAGGELMPIYPTLPPAVGYAVTATFCGSYPAAPGEKTYAMPDMIDAAQSLPCPRIAVFEDVDHPAVAATYGELMVTAFKTFGFQGLITSGAARDVEQVRALNFPCWASTIIASHGYSRFESVGQPVNVFGLTIHTGDLIHADGNGVASIPALLAPTVADLCTPYLDAERIILNALSRQDVSPASFRDAVKNMSNRMAELSIQAQRSAGLIIEDSGTKGQYNV